MRNTIENLPPKCHPYRGGWGGGYSSPPPPPPPPPLHPERASSSRAARASRLTGRSPDGRRWCTGPPRCPRGAREPRREDLRDASPPAGLDPAPGRRTRHVGWTHPGSSASRSCSCVPPVGRSLRVTHWRERLPVATRIIERREQGPQLGTRLVVKLGEDVEDRPAHQQERQVPAVQIDVGVAGKQCSPGQPGTHLRDRWLLHGYGS